MSIVEEKSVIEENHVEEKKKVTLIYLVTADILSPFKKTLWKTV